MPPKEWALGDDGEPIEVKPDHGAMVPLSARFTREERTEIIKYAVQKGLYLSKAIHDLVMMGVRSAGR